MPKRQWDDVGGVPSTQAGAIMRRLVGNAYELRGGNLLSGDKNARHREDTTMRERRSGGDQVTHDNARDFVANRSIPQTLSPPAASPLKMTTAPPLHNLIMFETPATMLPTPSPSVAQARAKSVSTVGTDAHRQPGLPSPAPSDGIAPSFARPLFAAPEINTPAAHGASFGNNPADSALHMQQQFGSLGASLEASLAAEYAPAHSVSFQLVTATQPAQCSQSASIPTAVPSHFMAMQQGFADVVPPIMPALQQAPSPLRPQVAPQAQFHLSMTSNAGYVSQATMLQTFNAFFCLPHLNLSETDCGRKNLLYDAIQQNDIFYITLSQVFCIRSYMPDYMPQHLRGVRKESWETLQRVLRSNDHLSPAALQFFAVFPKPLHEISASHHHLRMYVQQLLAVRAFLTELPTQLGSLINVSRMRLAPPLTQDMAQTLRLASPVLQTVVFRVISRIFWGSNENKGTKTLERLHKVDQQSFFRRRLVRTEAEKAVAYTALANVFRNYTGWIASGGQEDDFNVARELQFFHELPPSMIARNANLQATRLTAGLANQNHGSIAPRTANRNVKPHAAMQYVESHLSNRHLASNVSTAQPSPQRSTLQASTTRDQSATAYPLLFPTANDQPRLLPVRPDTVRVALHQAHLQSPKCGPEKLSLGAQPLYRHVVAYVLAPTAVHPTPQPRENLFTLTLSKQDIAQIAKIEALADLGARTSRILREGDHLYRLRCCEVPNGHFKTENAWVTAENVWPPEMTFWLNDQPLELRKKPHYGRYLPCDLSSMMKAGLNTLRISLGRSPKDMSKFDYAVAVEVIGVSSHTSILQNLKTTSATDSLAAIKHSLAGGSCAGDDDDIVMTSSTLTVNLFDPFTADRIFTIPVRGDQCLHRDCFDLETFLGQCEREKAGYPCVVDCWRCPICKADVRPQSMVKDGFLVEVREEFAKKGLLDTRAIIVEADGRWYPKVEKLIGVRSASAETELAARLTPRHEVSNKVIEMIELD